MNNFQAACNSQPGRAPSTRLAWEAMVNIGARQTLGSSPLGDRFLIPILGGEFAGELDGHVLQGQVQPGGADRQLWRQDGVRELDALYEMQLSDGTTLTVHNRVLIHDPADGERYAFSHVQVIAPAGPHDWLNKRVFVGTIHPLPPEQMAVLIRVWALT